MSQADEQVLDEVREVGPVAVSDIVRGIGLPENTVRDALRRLEARGDIEPLTYQLRARRYMAVEQESWVRAMIDGYCYEVPADAEVGEMFVLPESYVPGSKDRTGRLQAFGDCGYRGPVKRVIRRAS